MFTPDYLLDNIFSIDDDFLNKNNIKGIIFDIDNTLVGFTVAKPDEKTKEYIAQLQQKGIKVAIASNNSKDRVALFCEELGVEYRYRACKPLPFAILSLCKKMDIRASNVALVGDQVYTDTLGGNICGMTTVMVDIIDTKETMTFKIKRALEKPVINAKRRKDAKQNG